MADNASQNKLAISCGPAGEIGESDQPYIDFGCDYFNGDFQYHVKNLGDSHSFVFLTPEGATLGMFFNTTLDEAIGRFVRTRGGAGCFCLDEVETLDAKAERLTALCRHFEQVCRDNGISQPKTSDITLGEILRRVAESSEDASEVDSD